MEIKTKQKLFNEISMFKQNSPLTTAKWVLLAVLIIIFLIIGVIMCLASIPEHIPENIYDFARNLVDDYIVGFCILPFIVAAPLIIVENKIKDVINNKVAKYLGKDIQTNSEISPINFELLPSSSKNAHYKKSMKIVTNINGRYPIYNFRTTSKLSCVLSCSYNSIDYEISILNIYWEKTRKRGKSTYVEDYGTDYFAVISIIGKEFNNEPTELLRENKIDYCGHEMSLENKTEILIVERHKINVHGKFESKINMEIKLVEEIIEKAVKLSENIIDNN